jgi:hypothetical protein
MIPRNAESPREVTCANVDQRNQYIRDNVEVFGSCEDTDRFLSRAWCECDGVEVACALACDDGNPPPDLTKKEPVFGEACERFMYEYSTLSAEECPNAATALNFDSKAFCCNEPAPENCSICPAGQSIEDPDKSLRSEFFGNVTCGEIATHASYLPGDQCEKFINKLLDNPFGASDSCCVENEPGSSEAYGVTLTKIAACIGMAVFSILAL